MWDMRVYFTCPIQKLKCTFNTVYFDILCGQSLSGLSQMFQCVKEVPENMHRELTNSLKIVYVVIVFRGKLLKLWQGYFHQFCLLISIGKYKIKETLLVECSLSNITKIFFAKLSVSPSFPMFFYPFIKYVLCDRHCDIIIVIAVSIYIPFIMSLCKISAP